MVPYRFAMRNSRDRLWLSLLVAGSLALAGCGGGGGGGGSTPASTSTISGTAAGGAPVIGQITVKDSNGTIRTQNINLDGSYSVDVSGMTAPFLIRAQGTVGGQSIIFVSAATSADINGTVNVTPFTDLLISNIAGQLAGDYYNSPDFSQLTSQQLNDAKTALAQRLLPALQSVGLDSSFDLLHSAFSANHTGFDAVMDTIKVSYDSSANTAIIRDIINNTQISESLSDPGATTTQLPAPPVGSLSGGATALEGISSTLSSLSAMFAQGLPSDNAALRSLFMSDGSFLNGGEAIDTFIADITTDQTTIGLTFTNPVIVNDAENTATRLRVDVGISGPHQSDDVWNVVLIKGGDNIWRIDGNQRPVENNLIAENVRFIDGPLQPSWLTTSSQYQRELDLWVGYAPPTVDYLQVEGPGLGSPVLLHRSTSSDGWSVVELDGTDENGSTWVHACGDIDANPNITCIDFSQVPDNSVFTFTPLDSNKATMAAYPAYSMTLPRAPYSNSDAAANATAWFSSLTEATPANASSVTPGSSITVNFTMPTDSAFKFQSLYVGDSTELENSDVLNVDGHSATVTWNGTPTASLGLGVWTKGPFGRQFFTGGELPY